jgi:hypothetical protein
MQNALKVFDNLRAHPFLHFVAGAAFLLLGIAISDIPTMIESAQWPTTEGTIVKSRLVGTSVRGWDGDYFTETNAHIQYQYRVNGISYSSSAVNSIKSPFPLYSSSYVSRYPLGEDVIVYYNPKNPSEAVLEPGVLDIFKAFDIFSYLLFGAGIYYIYLGISRNQKERG